MMKLITVDGERLDLIACKFCQRSKASHPKLKFINGEIEPLEHICYDCTKEAYTIVKE